MRIPPKKPYFFKPLLPGFKDGLKIPVSFSKYLSGERPEYMLLRRGAKQWKEKISGQSLEEGWKSFAVDNNLEIGDFVVFKHEGNMVFEVMVFDPSHCEREYPWIYDVRSAEPKENEMSSKKFRSAGLRRKLATTNLTSKYAISSGSDETSQGGKVLTPKSRKHIPLKFARANNLSKRRRKLVLRNPQQRSWQVQLVPKTSHVYITRGWKAFYRENGLKLGDTFKFELVENGAKPILNFVPCLTSKHNEQQGPPRPQSTVKMNGKASKFQYG